MNKEIFLEEVRKLGINLTMEQQQKLDKFYHLLISWNEKINLTTITSEEEVYLKHFYDSLTLIKAIDLTKPLKVLDVGTGAGFPGIVLKIVFPNLEITLLDSMAKRINYLKEIIKDLELTNIKTVCSRVEDYARSSQEKYDLVVARAVAHLGILVEITMSLVKVKGYFVAMKGNSEVELAEAQVMLNKLGAQVTDLIEFKLPNENSQRSLVKIQKEQETPSKYPRKYDQIKKEYIKK